MKRTVLVLTAVLSLLSTLASCNAGGPSPDASSYFTIKETRAATKTLDSVGLGPENFPILDGATATQPIRALIAGAAFGGQCNWYETINKEMFLRLDLQNAGLTVQERELVYGKVARNSKTHDAYMSLIRGDIDLILVATKPSDDELNEAKRLGVRLELFPVGLDGLVFLVNEKNTVGNLTSQGIVDIYTAGIKNWKELGGADQPITAYTRETNSGSQELMEKLVMKGVPMDPSVRTEKSIIISMAPLIEGVEFNQNSIGYSLYYYKNNMIDKRPVRPLVKLVSVDGVEPTPVTIASRQYPYVFSIYAVTRSGQPKDSKAYQLKEWLTSREGQDLIAKAGYVRLDQR